MYRNLCTLLYCRNEMVISKKISQMFCSTLYTQSVRNILSSAMPMMVLKYHVQKLMHVAILQKRNGETNPSIAKAMNISTHWVKKLGARYRHTDTYTQIQTRSSIWLPWEGRRTVFQDAESILPCWLPGRRTASTPYACTESSGTVLE